MFYVILLIYLYFWFYFQTTRLSQLCKAVLWYGTLAKYLTIVIRFFHPRHNGQWPPTSKDFYTRSYPLHYFLILILEKEAVFPFSMLTICVTSLVWRGPSQAIEPGTSRTRSQHSNTRLSRRRLRTLKQWTYVRVKVA